jgi:hypothetical protein
VTPPPAAASTIAMGWVEARLILEAFDVQLPADLKAIAPQPAVRRAGQSH